jgi:hypothetical protein
VSTTPDPDPAAERAAFREFVRAHHPDRGGDPDTFAAGLARFGRGAPPAPPAESTVPATRPADRHPTPPDVVADLPFPVRVGVALIRTWHRRRDPRDPRSTR